jgi:hypothetical protein
VKEEGKHISILARMRHALCPVIDKFRHEREGCRGDPIQQPAQRTFVVDVTDTRNAFVNGQNRVNDQDTTIPAIATRQHNMEPNFEDRVMKVIMPSPFTMMIYAQHEP